MAIQSAKDNLQANMISENENEDEDGYALSGVLPFGFCWNCGEDLYLDMKDECHCQFLARDWDLYVPSWGGEDDGMKGMEIPPRLPSNFLIASSSENTVIYQESPDSSGEEVYFAYEF